MERIVLASASPRRAALLREAGVDFEVLPAGVDESILAGEAPEAYVERIARAKAMAVAARVPKRIVLAADTAVVSDGQIFTKPADRQDAARMLAQLSGKAHTVVTGVALASPGGLTAAVASTTVEFVPLTDEDIEWYVATGEPADKAGAYAIQGLGARFIRRIVGSRSNVVGLPIQLVREMLLGMSEGRLGRDTSDIR